MRLFNRITSVWLRLLVDSSGSGWLHASGSRQAFSCFSVELTIHACSIIIAQQLFPLCIILSAFIMYFVLLHAVIGTDSKVDVSSVIATARGYKLKCAQQE